MSTYFVQLPGALIMRIDEPASAFKDAGARVLLAAYLPGMQFLPHANWVVDLHVIYEDRKTFSFRDSGNFVNICDEWKGESSLMDLLFICYGMARRAWLAKGIFPVHAAALQMGESDDGLTLLVGHSGIGKTALTLASVKAGARVFSGNKTLVTFNGKGMMKAIAGTHPITAKSQDLVKHGTGYAIRSVYGNRSAFILQDGHYSSAAPRAVKLIAVPKLNDGVSKDSALTGASGLHKLYPYFMDTVNADIVVAGGKAVLSGNPADGVRERLVEELSRALPKLSVVELEGSLEYVSGALKEGFKRTLARR